ncbi:carbohydrate ABC transporter permease [Halococcus sp. IIIV-5B]|uniref:carbohydrate ABC transporter permease n=1 Tax=Halococcus sp. IIIV-5B TaxID=2321230 RepID=UPI000E72FFFC|nr:carbohydrate ABC transporter permease [Halococcus sp. IIIV-5B]RJT07976.1 carbohydrate ABC transporter permease [Halococcus sp. IIIV-5B]
MFEGVFGGPGGLVPNTVQKRLSTVGLYLIAILVTIFVLTPLYLMVVVAIQSPQTLFSGGDLTLIPPTVSLENFRTLINGTPTVTYFVNSIIITGASVLLSTVLAVVSGYSLTRYDISGKSLIARIVLFSYMVSPIVLAVPLYVIFFKIGLLNQYISAILAVTAISAPFSIWLMWQYFQNIPIAYEESAWTRGASRWRAVRDVILPLARPGYISVAIFSFAVAWNDYAMVRVVLNDQALYPLTVGSELIFQEVFVGWGEQMSMMLIMSLPPFLVAAFLQNYLLQGFNLGHG